MTCPALMGSPQGQGTSTITDGVPSLLGLNSVLRPEGPEEARTPGFPACGWRHPPWCWGKQSPEGEVGEGAGRVTWGGSFPDTAPSQYSRPSVPCALAPAHLAGASQTDRHGCPVSGRAGAAPQGRFCDRQGPCTGSCASACPSRHLMCSSPPHAHMKMP